MLDEKILKMVVRTSLVTITEFVTVLLGLHTVDHLRQ